MLPGLVLGVQGKQEEPVLLRNTARGGPAHGWIGPTRGAPNRWRNTAMCLNYRP
jgi:hypothetical protein